MALRLQMRGYIIRWATYSKGGFKEGVSLTVDDELNRWQKYAYGQWLVRLLVLRSVLICGTQAVTSCSSTLSLSGGAGAPSRTRSTSSCGPERLCTTSSRCLRTCSRTVSPPHATLPCPSALAYLDPARRRYRGRHNDLDRELHPAGLPAPRRRLLHAQFRDLARDDSCVHRIRKRWIYPSRVPSGREVDCK